MERVSHQTEKNEREECSEHGEKQREHVDAISTMKHQCLRTLSYFPISPTLSIFLLIPIYWFWLSLILQEVSCQNQPVVCLHDLYPWDQLSKLTEPNVMNSTPLSLSLFHHNPFNVQAIFGTRRVHTDYIGRVCFHLILSHRERERKRKIISMEGNMMHLRMCKMGSYTFAILQQQMSVTQFDFFTSLSFFLVLPRHYFTFPLFFVYGTFIPLFVLIPCHRLVYLLTFFLHPKSVVPSDFGSQSSSKQ